MSDGGSGATPSFAAQVAAATGLAGLLAEGALRRCCERANIELESMTPRDLRRILAQLEPILELYLTPDQCRDNMAKLRQLAEPVRRR
jgi:hypothetical protein